MLSSFLSGGSNAAVKLFEIRVEQDHILFRGPEGAAPDGLLQGTVVLCLTEPLRIQEIKLRFTGEFRAR